ncbi:Pentatricopeptide repeat-containing protein [Drosera capensis]
MATSKLRSISSHLISLTFQKFYHTSTRARRSLYAKISPLGSPALRVRPELDSWIDKGKKVSVAELQRIVRDFRKRKRFSHALEVLEWMKERGIIEFSASEHAVKLDLIGKLNGYVDAENYFQGLPDQDKTDKTYGALLNCYVRQRETEKSLLLFHRMREMGFASSTLTYNDLMCLYTYTEHHDKVPEVLAEMKRNGVKPDNYSYRICINSFGVRSNIEGMEKILKEMMIQPHIAMDWNTYAVAAHIYMKADLTAKAIDALKKAEVRLDEEKDGESYNFLISLYAKLGNCDEVLRLWKLEKSACNRCINRDYINVLKALVRLGELEKARTMLKEWEVSRNSHDPRVPDVLIAAYWGNGLFEKAKEVIKELASKGKACSPKWTSLVEKRSMEKVDIEEVLDDESEACSLTEEKVF